jgi:DNA-binding transcriptional regulator LsrR (DeoR family)
MLYQVAKRYYEHRRTQVEISREFQTSRSTVSRLLQRAVDQEIVVIKIRYPWRRNTYLEQKLMERFRLLDVRVLDIEDDSEEKLLAGTGSLAARLVGQSIKVGDVVGVSCGRSVANTVRALGSGRQAGITVVPIAGSLSVGNNAIDTRGLVRQFASAYRGELHCLPCPLLVKDGKTRDALMRSPEISKTLALATKANVILIGIGEPVDASPIWKGYLDRRNLDWAITRGAVGHMCGQFFDGNGNMLLISTNERSIGMGIENLRKIDRVIAVASGKHKAPAMRGALKGGFFNILVTDRAAAETLLDLD